MDDKRTRREFGALVVAAGMIAGVSGSASAQTAEGNLLKFFEACTPLSDENVFVKYVLRNISPSLQPHWIDWETDKVEFMQLLSAEGIVFEETSGDGGEAHAHAIYDAIRTMNGEILTETSAPSTDSAWVQLGNLYDALTNGNASITFIG